MDQIETVESINAQRIISNAIARLSDLTSQPNFNSIIEMTKHHERANPINIQSLNSYSNYWENIREYYYPFESDLKAGTAEVYTHEIPGGQYSNLRPQATALGLGDRFDEVKKMYAEVNMLFGNLVKVTPSSKVVGDMAIYMVTNNLTTADIFERGSTLSFPESVVSFFKGDLGQPKDGFPKKLQAIILKNEQAYTDRPNAHLQPIDFDKEFKAFKKKFQKDFSREIEFEDFLSYSLYPRVFEQAHEKYKLFGNVSILPTKNFFFGMQQREEIMVELEPGKTIIVKLLSVTPPNDEGKRMVFFKVNGENRFVEIEDKSMDIKIQQNSKADADNDAEYGAPLQGMLYKILVKPGQEVKENDHLFIIEAMKMETTVTALTDGTVSKIELNEGIMVMTGDLILKID